MSTPTFGGAPRPDLRPIPDDPGVYEDGEGGIYMPDDAPPSDGTKPIATTTTRYHGRVLEMHKVLAEPDEPIPWRCDNLIADGFLTVIAGRGGEGKSFLSLALACGVARGQNVAGIDCMKGKVLLIDAENGPKLIARRFRAMRMTAELDVQPVDAGGLTFAKDFEWFRNLITQHKPSLVVFDSLRVLASGVKESESDAMEPVITRLKQLARDTGCAIVLIHHRGKSESSNYRGSSAILDQCDVLFTLSRCENDPEARHRRKLTAVKVRIDEEPAPRWVSIVTDRDRGLVSIETAEPFEGEGARRRDTQRDDVLAQITGISQSGARIAVALGRAKTDGTVRRVLADLEADGEVEKRADGWGLPTSVAKGTSNPGNPPEMSMDTGDQGLPAPLATPPDLHVDGTPYGPRPDWWPSS